MKHIILLVCCGISLAAEAGREDDLDRVVGKTQRELLNQSIEKEKVLRSLYNIGKEMQKTVIERSKFDQEHMVLESQIRDLTSQVASLREQLERHRDLVARRLVAMRSFNRQTWSKFMLEAHNSARLERNAKMLSVLAQADLKNFKEFALQRASVDAAKMKVQSRLQMIESLRKQILVKENALKEQNEIRKQVLKQIRISQKSTVERLQSLRAHQTSGSALEESGLFDGLTGPSFFDKKGELFHPVDGRLIRRYGIQRPPESFVRLSHRGWFYETADQTPVRVVFDGKVALIENFPELGLTLVVDHGEHFYTVYSGLSRLSVGVAENVSEGKTIAFTGISPFDQRSGIYFEIRHFSEAIDPRPWIKGRSYDITDAR